ncbi:MAG: putative permease [Bacteroidia bacterium]|jgi:predicted permease
MLGNHIFEGTVIGSIVPVVTPVIVCIVLGAWWARSQQRFPSEFVGDLVMKIGAPALIVGTLGATELAPGALLEVLAAAFVMLTFSAFLSALTCKLFGWPLRDIGLPIVFGNSGNMGLPLCLFAFGSDGLALSLGIFVVFSLVHFSLGTAALTSSMPGRALLRSPLIWAGLLVLLMIALDLQFPLTVNNTLDILGGMAIPLMLLTLGVSLVSLRLRDSGRALAMGLARVVTALLAGVLTVEVLQLEGLLRGVVLLQAATPAAVFNYLLAQQYQRSPEAVAGLVMASTLLSFVSIPLVLAYLV